jgi:hypothetical protein
MKFLFIFFALVLFSQNAQAEVVQLSRKQFQNLDKINEVLKEKYPQYKGCSGPMGAMDFEGLPADTVTTEISALNFVNIEKEDIEVRREAKKILKKSLELAADAVDSETPLQHRQKAMALLLANYENA